MHEEALTKTMSSEEFEERFGQLHTQLWASSEFAFDDVTKHVFTPPAGYYQVDHSFIRENDLWHLYYVTGDMRLTEAWNQHRKAGRYVEANEVCVEPGNGHAFGKTLFELEFVENVFLPSQGDFDLMSRGVCSLFRFHGRFGMLYDVRGSRGEVMSLAWSDDLSNWDLEPNNPILVAPEWAVSQGAFKDPHVLEIGGTYLIYAVAWVPDGQLAVCLFTTDDWRTYHDQGAVYTMSPALRGTFGIESPQVFERNGMWHLFFTHGPGLFHAVSPSPVAFLAGRDESSASRVRRGAYCMGPFHATEIVRDGEDWWLTTDRKEETRRINRADGRLCYRGSYDDEKTLEEGLYVSRIEWDGDQPLLRKPV